MTEREERQKLLISWMQACPDDMAEPRFIEGVQRGVTYTVREIDAYLEEAEGSYSFGPNIRAFMTAFRGALRSKSKFPWSPLTEDEDEQDAV